MTKRGKGKSTQKTIDLLLENNVMLQKAMTNLATNLDNLTKRLDKFISLVEKASDEIATGEKSKFDSKLDMKLDDNLSSKLDSLMQQNRTIAKGLLLLDRYVKEKNGEEEERVKPLPEFNLSLIHL